MDKQKLHSTMDQLSEILDYKTPVKEDGDEDSDVIDTSRITGGENILLYGVPGAGKSWTIANEYCSDEQYICRVVFHPDYTNSDFVGQILPRINKSTGKLEYTFVSGPFTNVLSKAYADPGHMYYLVIEEINRGNAAAIFGEVFQLLDRNENGESLYGITNYDIALQVFNDEDCLLRIPSNLTLLATMNTSDQNVFTLDTAFQRRWSMRHISNDIKKAVHSEQHIEGTTIDWCTFATVINEHILQANEGLASSEDKRLGAYFVTGKELSEKYFPEKVLKYLWDDAFRLERDYIFTDEMRSFDMVIDTYKESKTDKLKSVLRTKIYDEMISRMTEEDPN